MNEAPFGIKFEKSVPVSHIELPYDPMAQTTQVSDDDLMVLAASDNTLTGTAGPDNDFDD